MAGQTSWLQDPAVSNILSGQDAMPEGQWGEPTPRRKLADRFEMYIEKSAKLPEEKLRKIELRVRSMQRDRLPDL